VVREEKFRNKILVFCSIFEENKPKADFAPGKRIFRPQSDLHEWPSVVSTHLVPDNEMKGKTARTTFI
jgi:hypothetical protein